jgi:uncharacterized membrane protein YiaA
MVMETTLKDVSSKSLRISACALMSVASAELVLLGVNNALKYRSFLLISIFLCLHVLMAFSERF